MVQVPSAEDSAVREPFFSLPQSNVVNRRRWKTREQLRTVIIAWIEGIYRHRSRRVRPAKLALVEYETIVSPSALAASPNRPHSCRRPAPKHWSIEGEYKCEVEEKDGPRRG